MNYANVEDDEGNLTYTCKFKPKENVCECGHEEGHHDKEGRCHYHFDDKEGYCSCKKFKPKICPQCDMGVSSCLCKQKGCGKMFNDGKWARPVACNGNQLCPKCKGNKTP